eukprot:7381927-Prymnesium_polylepis.2
MELPSSRRLPLVPARFDRSEPARSTKCSLGTTTSAASPTGSANSNVMIACERDECALRWVEPVDRLAEPRISTALTSSGERTRSFRGTGSARARCCSVTGAPVAASISSRSCTSSQ